MKPLSLTVKNSNKKPRQKTQNARQKKLLLKKITYIGLVLTLIVIPLSGWVLWKYKVVARSVAFINDKINTGIENGSELLGLTLKNVYLEGQNFIPEQTIIEKIDLREQQPIMTISLTDIKQKLKSLEWVKEVNIERQIPSTMHIRIVEKTPMAIWQYQGKLVLIDEKGMVISANHIAKFKELPIIVGKNANEHAERLFEILNMEEKLAKQVSSAIWVGDRRWNVRLNNSIEILLPEENAEEAWLYLAELDRTKKLFKRDIKSVDLRLPDKIFIRTSTPVTQG